MSTKKTQILRLIEEEVNRALLEQDETPAPEPGPEPAADDTAALDLGGDAEGGDLDLGGDTGGGDLDLGGDLEGGLEGEEGDLEGDDGDFSGDLGGGFGGFGGGGGGFDFGDDGETGLEPDEEAEADTLGVIGPEDVEIPEDPVMAIADDAIAMLNQTRNPGAILKSTKASIQQYFGDFEDATPVIKALWDTEDITLRDVARRLLLFIKGS